MIDLDVDTTGKRLMYLSHVLCGKSTESACLKDINGLLTLSIIVQSIIEPAEVLVGDSAGSLGRPSSSKPPNPFQRLALIIGRLGLQCMRLAQMLGSKSMGALIQAMRGMLRLRGR